jgi:plastocyanin
MVRIVITMLAVAGAATAPLVAVAHAEPAGGPGSIRGTVIFEGEAPERARLRRDTDPLCAKREAFSEDIIVNSGKLKDVLVRIKNGSLPAPRAVPPPAVIDQKNCTYTPHVVGLVVGQKLALRNSDATFHNVHGWIAGKDAWNKPSASGDPELVVDSRARAGDVIDIKCDIHRWMRAYAVVQDHTAFAVTDERGAFEITGLPPGSYTLEAWHPVLGTRTLEVKIGSGAKAAVTARISFKRSDLKAP